MKTLQRPCAAFVLTLALALSALAGDMTTGITAPPRPPGTSQTTAQGEMTTGVAGDMTTGITATDSATEVLLSLLQSLLALF